MRELNLFETTSITGAYSSSNTTEFFFELKPGLEVIGFEEKVVGYQETSNTWDWFFGYTRYVEPIRVITPIYGETAVVFY
jgi:hypothetical protein